MGPLLLAVEGRSVILTRMKRLPLAVALVILALLRAAVVCAQAPGDLEDSAIKERRRLFVIAAMAHAYTRLHVQPKPGLDASTVLAWGFDKGPQPPFIIERDRQIEREGDIYHAEVNVLKAAYQRKSRMGFHPQTGSEERYGFYADSLAGAVVFSTLEPCPMCVTSMHMAKVARGFYCMEDPNLRDVETRELQVHLPDEFYNRRTQTSQIDLPACRDASDRLWAAWKRAGDRRLSAALAGEGEAIFRPFYEMLRAFPTGVSAPNIMLAVALKEMVGEPLARESIERAAEEGNLFSLGNRLDGSDGQRQGERMTLPDVVQKEHRIYLMFTETLKKIDQAATADPTYPSIPDILPALAAEHRTLLRSRLGLENRVPDGVVAYERDLIHMPLPKPTEPLRLTLEQVSVLLRTMDINELNAWISLPVERRNAYLNQMALRRYGYLPGAK